MYKNCTYVNYLSTKLRKFKHIHLGASDVKSKFCQMQMNPSLTMILAVDTGSILPKNQTPNPKFDANEPLTYGGLLKILT